MSASEIRAVIFDCDGTLVDSETLSLAVLVEMVADFGVDVSHAEAMERFAGNELSVVFAEIEGRLGRTLPPDFLDRFRSRQLDVLRKRLQPIDGADELLQSLRKPFCVASNAPVNKIEVCLQTTRLDRHFCAERIFSAYTIEKWKPAPDLFLQAAAEMGVAPEHCAVVEDSQFGVKAGLAAGMQVFGYQVEDAGLLAETRVTPIGHLSELFRHFHPS